MTLRGRGVLAVLMVATVHAAAAATLPGEILWDQYAVPHIYGPDIPTVVRGLGYAQMENHAETLLNLVARQRGRSAEYFGPGPSNFNVQYDTQVRTYGIPARAAAWAAQGGAFQTSVLQAFCDGVNEYATQHPGDILPQLQQILPVLPVDIAAEALNTINYTFLPEQDGVPSLIAAWLQGGMAAVAAMQPTRRNDGSNGWAISPAKSADGHAILVGNPHLPWGVNQPIDDDQGGQNFGIYQWMEANLVIGNPSAPSLNASGVTFVGGPFIGIGFNDYLGWTHTNNTIQNADLYQLTLDSTGTKYLFGGAYLPLQHTTSAMKVLQPDGSHATQVIDIYNSIHGPVVAFNAARTRALALRVAGLNQTAIVTQYWNMIQAHNLQQFKAAESMLQMPFFNTIYADRAGDIYYLFGGQQPMRTAGTPPSDYFNKIQDGTDPAKLWTQTLPFAQLPQVANPLGGFIANSNNPPWTSALPQPPQLDPTAYPTYIAPNLMDFRPQHGATFLSSPPYKLNTAQVTAGKMSTEMYLADRIADDLIGFANAAAGDATAAKAAAILSAWDHTADQDSAGGALFEQWWNNVVADVIARKIVPDHSLAFDSPHPKFVVPWQPANPLTTPRGLDPVNETQLVADLDAAYTTVAANFASLGGAAVTWGNAHKTTLAFRSGATQALTGLAANDPLSGADDPFGPIRVVNAVYVGVLGEFISYGGDGYVQVIDFGPGGSTGGSVLTYGNASRPNSPHIVDQLPFFETKTLKPALRTLSAVQAAAVAVEYY